MGKVVPNMNDLQDKEDGESYASSSSSSTDGFYNHYNNQLTVSSSSSSSSSSSLSTADRRRLDLASSRAIWCAGEAGRSDGGERNTTDTNNDQDQEEEADSSLLVKVYMEGNPISWKLDLTVQRGYHTLFPTLSYMFNVPIFCPDVNNKGITGKSHILTYEDKDGDWMLVGDVPWEMFLNTVKKLRIQRHVS